MNLFVNLYDKIQDYSESPNEYDMQVTIDMFDIKVQHDFNGTFAYTVNYKESVWAEKRQLEYKDVNKIPHEIISNLCFLADSDERMDTIELLNDATDRQTPDLILRVDENTWIVLEIKTIRNPSKAHQRFLESHQIYRQACDKRSMKNTIYLYTLIVSENKVVSNLVLSESDVQSILIAYNLGFATLSRMREIGWYSYDNDEFYKIRELEVSMSKLSIPFKSDDPLIITREKLDFWRSLKDDSKIYKYNLRKAYDRTLKETSADNLKIAQSRVDEFYNMLQNGRLDKKSPIQLPLFTREEVKANVMDLLYGLGFNDVLNRVWRSAITDFLNHQERWKEVNEEQMLLRALEEVEIEEKTDKKEHFRVNVSLADSDWLELAKLGIEGRKRSMFDEVKIKRENDKIPFSINADVSDIESFISDNSLLESCKYQNILTKRVSKLIKAARFEDNIREKVPCKKSLDTSLRFTEMFFQTELGNMLTTLQSLLMEVNISRLQNCKKGQFVFKYCESANCYLLIKPTKASEHIFFSVAIPPGSICYGKPFKEPISLQNGWKLVDFVSMDTNRLSHQIATPERCCSLLSFWCHQFEVIPEEIFASKNESVIRHFLASVLIYMEDKESTSSSLQNIRYAYMEMVKGVNRLMDPFKILTKVSHRPRSRILIWAYKRITNAFLEMIKRSPIFGSREEQDLIDEASQDIASNLISWVTNEPIGKFEIALNLSYLGVLHNKEEGNKIHGFLKIFEKVIQEERELKKCNHDYFGNTDPPVDHDFKSHEFSPTFVAMNGRAVKKYLSNKGGGMQWIIDKIKRTLINKDVLDLATMKSSAYDIIDQNYDFESEMNKRRRAAEGVKEQLGKGIKGNYMLDIHKIEKEVQLEGGLRANLFKKLQIGGTREIFVLTMPSRMLVHFCESICREVCEELPNEMLTKGDQKLIRNDFHFRQLHNTPGNYSTTVTSSDDATTWAQRFVMPAFACFLCQIFDDDIMVPIACVLNHCTNKKLELPKELLSLFLDNPDVMSFSDNINELKRQFLGISEDQDLLKKNSILLTNRSNMMQGIFHYTSSLFHAGYLLSWAEFSKLVIKASLPTLKDPIITTKVSSDDSSVLMSAKFEKSKNRLTINKVFQTLIYLKEEMYKYMCCKQSKEKSTTAVFWTIEEFNSTWLMRNTLLMPLIKFVVSSTQIHTTPKIESRLQVAATLRSQLLENCGTCHLASIVQICQARLHYLALGAMTNKLWPKFSDQLLSKPHPSCGFMPFEPDYFCGMLGYDFSCYFLFKHNDKAREIHSRFYKNLGVEFNKEGTQTSRVFLSHGQNQRYLSFLKNMGLANKSDTIRDINEEINQRAEMLYRKAETDREFQIKLLIKCADPDLSQSFSFLNSSKIFASSVYILQEPCLHLVNGIRTDGTLKIEKVSLMKWIEIVDKQGENDVDVINLMFPSWQFYDRIIDEVFNLAQCDWVRIRRRRRVFISVPIPKQSTLTPLTLLDCVRKYWFDHDVRGSSAALEATFEYFKEFYPWLSRIYSETLKNGPFDNHIALFRFIMSLTPTNKSVRLTSPSRSKASGFLTIVDGAYKNQWPGHILTRTCESKESIESNLDQLLNSLWIMKNSPPTRDLDYVIYKTCRSLPQIIGDHPNLADIMTQGLMRFNVMMTQYAVYNPEKTIDLLQKFNRGIFGGFTVRQEVSAGGAYVGRGTFCGVIDGVKFRLDLEDDRVKNISTPNKNAFINKSLTFKHFLFDMKLRLQADKGIGDYYGMQGTISEWKPGTAKITEEEVTDYFVRKTVRVTCDQFGRIRIKTCENRPVTVLSYVPSIRHFVGTPTTTARFDDKLCDVWASNSSVDFKEGLELFEKAYDEDMRYWVFRSFLRRMRSRSFIVKEYAYELDNIIAQENAAIKKHHEKLDKLMEESAHDEDDSCHLSEGEMELDFADWDMKDINEMITLEEVKEDEYGPNEWEMGDFDLTKDVFMDSEDYITRQPIRHKLEPDIFLHHKFWDNVIDELVYRYGWINLERCVNLETVWAPELQLIKNFMIQLRKIYNNF